MMNNHGFVTEEGDERAMCPECSGENYKEVHHDSIGTYLVCSDCGWDNANDVFEDEE